MTSEGGIRHIFFHYLPYGALDLLITLAVIVEISAKRWDLLFSNLPIVIWGMITLNRKLRTENLDSTD